MYQEKLYKKIIDLRSDTVTKPSREMLNTCFSASVQDSFFEADESTRALEELAFRIFGFEDAMFTVSGTMSNQIAVKAHTNPGDSVVIDETYHINYYESSSTAIISNVCLSTVKAPLGIIEKDLLEEVIKTRSKSIYNSKIKLLSLENSINFYSGKIYPYEKLYEISEYARFNGWKVHLDGARIFNALAAEKVSPISMSKICDSMMISLSKGLGAPFGAILLGSKEFINHSRILNKWLGGGMHQSGILAEMGFYALSKNFERIKIDNENARYLFSYLKKENIKNVNIREVETNIVMIDLRVAKITSNALVKNLELKGIKLHQWSEFVVRAVVNLSISHEDIKRCAVGIAQAIKELSDE